MRDRDGRDGCRHPRDSRKEWRQQAADAEARDSGGAAAQYGEPENEEKKTQVAVSGFAAMSSR
jgi:hypothetical protein